MIDAYAHCGISRYQPAEDVRATMRAASVERAVLVQHLGEYDNSYIEKVVGENAGILAGVALLDYSQPDWEERLLEIQAAASFRGLRLTAGTLAANPSTAVTAARIGLVPVLYLPDGVAPVKHLIRDVVSAAPDSPWVITHLGCPAVEADEVVEGWDLLELAELPNLLVTLSGLALFCPYPYLPLGGFIRNVLDAFTPERILWGSNYPVGGGVSNYVRDLDLVLSGGWGLADEQIRQITETNSAAVFFAAYPD